jgi:uncharacterized protein YutE (UPF0331/DUF86 family)
MEIKKFDMEEVNKRIDYINERLKTLKLAIEDYKIQKKKFEKYKSLKTIERDAEEIIECATRINQEVLKNNDEFADTYRESFELLFELEIIDDEDYCKKLANTTGFRNRLAHDYIELDPQLTLKTGENILKLYPKYLLKVIDYISSI